MKAGMILCGGMSQRMGQDKSSLLLGGQPLLCVQLERLTQCVDQCVVVAGPSQTLPELPRGVQLVRDEQLGQGPLAALERGMSHLPGNVDRLLLCGVDAPLLQPKLGVWLLQQLDTDDSGQAWGACVLWDRPRWHPMPASYHVRILPELRALLKRGERSLSQMLECIPVRVCSTDDIKQRDPELLSYLSANTPAEFAQLKERFASLHR